MMRLHKILLTLVCFTVLSAHAQWKWLNPLECGFLSYKTKDGPKRSETVTFGFPKEPKARYVNPSGIYPATPPVWQFIFQQRP